MEPTIRWYGHDAFAFGDGQVTLFIDPFQLPPTVRPADIICLTHEHFDHCSPEDIARLTGPHTTIMAPAICRANLPNIRFMPIAAGNSLTIGSVTITAVPAYNIDKKFHPLADGRVGYVVTIAGQRIYHAGDTDLIPEMKNLQADVALLPVSGTYVMTAEEAAEAATLIKPKVTIPMHYGSIIGTIENAKRFSELVPNSIQVKILEKTT